MPYTVFIVTLRRYLRVAFKSMKWIMTLMRERKPTATPPSLLGHLVLTIIEGFI
jgi:hypothetical protein